MPATSADMTNQTLCGLLLFLQEVANALNLIVAHERWRVAAAFDFEHPGAGVATDHLAGKI